MIQAFRAVNSIDSLVIVRKSFSSEQCDYSLKTRSDSGIAYFSNPHFQGRFISTMELIKEHGTAKQNAFTGPILRNVIVITHPQCHSLFIRGFYNFF
jgi:hypothetical protein